MIHEMLKPIQRRVGVTADGIFGPATARGINDALDATQAVAPFPDVPAVSAKPVRPPSAPMTFAQSQIDTAFLKLAFPQNNVAELAQWVVPTRRACVEWGIDTFREVCSFLANIGVESAGLTRLSENLNYSSAALITKFGRHRISVADAKRYGRGNGHAADQEALANILYGGAWGAKNLGNTQPGDGWKYRGYGPKQLTGKHNQGSFAASIRKPVDAMPAYLRTRDGGMRSAGWFWETNNLDAAAATPGLADDRRKINGGAFGLASVEEVFNVLIEELLRRENIA